MWQAGDDIASKMKRRAFYMHRKALLPFGVDIAVKSNVTQLKPRTRVIMLGPVTPPDFYELPASKGNVMELTVEVIGMKAFKGVVQGDAIDSGKPFTRTKLNERNNRPGELFAKGEAIEEWKMPDAETVFRIQHLPMPFMCKLEIERVSNGKENPSPHGRGHRPDHAASHAGGPEYPASGQPALTPSAHHPDLHRISGSFGAGKPEAMAKAPAVPAPAFGQTPVAMPLSVASAPEAAASSASPSQGDKPARAYAGCSIFRGQCTCHDDDGRRAKVEPEICAAEMDFGQYRKADHQAAALVDARGYVLPPAPPTPAELDAMAFMAKRRD